MSLVYWLILLILADIHNNNTKFKKLFSIFVLFLHKSNYMLFLILL